MARQLIGLGEAYEVTFRRDDNKKVETVRFPRFWWAWDGSATAGNIRLVRVVSQGGVRLQPNAKAMHRRFHGSDPDAGVQVDAQPVTAPLRLFGRVISFAYDARKIASTKSDAVYRHHFGAFDHDDKPPFGEESLPDIALDGVGQLIIKRRPSNTFRLDDYVIG